MCWGSHNAWFWNSHLEWKIWHSEDRFSRGIHFLFTLHYDKIFQEAAIACEGYLSTRSQGIDSTQQGSRDHCDPSRGKGAHQGHNLVEMQYLCELQLQTRQLLTKDRHSLCPFAFHLFFHTQPKQYPLLKSHISSWISHGQDTRLPKAYNQGFSFCLLKAKSQTHVSICQNPNLWSIHFISGGCNKHLHKGGGGGESKNKTRDPSAGDYLCVSDTKTKPGNSIVKWAGFKAVAIKKITLIQDTCGSWPGCSPRTHGQPQLGIKAESSTPAHNLCCDPRSEPGNVIFCHVGESLCS